jgi:hypothetical protein
MRSNENISLEQQKEIKGKYDCNIKIGLIILLALKKE